MEIASRISIDKKIHSGKPVITGTRVPVDLVVGKITGGMTIDEVMREYELERDDVLAALAYAENMKQRAKDFAVIHEIRAKTKGKDPKQIERDVAEAIKQVRAKRAR
jgi:uncharacterized protein (DUF433 family)